MMAIVTMAYLLPPIRADTAYEAKNGEPQLLKMRLKTENLHSIRNNGIKISFWRMKQ